MEPAIRVLQIVDEKTGRELGAVLVYANGNIYNECAYPVCKCGRIGPDCQSPGEALDELLDHDDQHKAERHNGTQHELPWPIEF